MSFKKNRWLILGFFVILSLFVSFKVGRNILDDNRFDWLSFVICSIVAMPTVVYIYIKKQNNRELETIIIGIVVSLFTSFYLSIQISLVANLINLYLSKNNPIKSYMCDLSTASRESSFLKIGYNFNNNFYSYYYSGKSFSYPFVEKNLKYFKLQLMLKKGLKDTYIIEKIELVNIPTLALVCDGCQQRE